MLVSPKENMDETQETIQRYHRPYKLMNGLLKKINGVIPSIKLSHEKIDFNRYYLDHQKLNLRKDKKKIDTLVDQLNMPVALRKRLQEYLNIYDDIRFVGAGGSHNEMTYRIYLGFDGREHNSDSHVDHSAISMDWNPDSGKYLYKTYDEYRAIPRDHELKLISRCMPTEQGSESANAIIKKAIESITEQARGALHVTQVKEKDGKRNSVTFNYQRCAYTANKDIEKDLKKISEALKIDASTFQELLNNTSDLHLLDIAIGLAWNDKPFVTLYYGILEEPPQFSSSDLGVLARAKRLNVRDGFVPSGFKRQSTISPQNDNSQIKKKVDYVFTLGTIGYDFFSPSHRDGFVKSHLPHPEQEADMLKHLKDYPEHTADLIWTIKQNNVPVYNIKPVGAYNAHAFDLIRRLFEHQLKQQSGKREQTNYLAYAGIKGGQVSLLGGQQLPLLYVNMRGFQLANQMQLACTKNLPDYWATLQSNSFNTGDQVSQRAMNFVATSVQLVQQIDRQLNIDLPNSKNNYFLDGFSCAQSQPLDNQVICDVKLTFFNIKNRSQPKRIFLIKIDVTHDIPVQIGVLRNWCIN